MSTQPEVMMAEQLNAGEEMNPALAVMVERIADPPVLSTVGIKLIYELRQEETSVKKLSEIVQSEPGLAAKVLRHANSSYYGIRNRIQSIHHAITMLGWTASRRLPAILTSIRSRSNFPAR
jgi:HD-like signal output (HDOD) protein